MDLRYRGGHITGYPGFNRSCAKSPIKIERKEYKLLERGFWHSLDGSPLTGDQSDSPPLAAPKVSVLCDTPLLAAG
jgi:hypothetical protein